jgi:DNA-directed RNA polymerase specialized sigma24 family protein
MTDPKATRIGKTEKVIVVEDPYDVPEEPVEVPDERPVEEPAEPTRTSNVLEILRRLRRLRRRGDELEDKTRALVADARAAGASWADIAGALGVARSSAWERFRDLEEQVDQRS